MADTPSTNGTARPQTPTKPQHNGLALTEYSAHPSPPSSVLNKQETRVPPDFLLPSGYPDVCECMY